MISNQFCPICEKPLEGCDSIVTCPICGTPHHGECYKKLGHCKNENLHQSGFEFNQNQNSNDDSGENSSSDEISCPVCSQKNPVNTIFCINCGTPIQSTIFGGSAPGGGNPGAGGMPPGGGFGQAGGAPGGIFCGNPAFLAPINPNEDIDGQKAGDIAAYVGQSAPVYINKFKALLRTKFRISWNWSSFFFGPLYYAYRKMWFWTVISFLLTLVTVLPVLVDMAAAATNTETAAQLPNFLRFFMVEENYSDLTVISSIASMIGRLLLALFTNSLYLSKVKRAIKKQYKLSTSNGSDGSPTLIHSALAKKGGVSSIGCFIFLILMSVAIGGYIYYLNGLL